MIFSAKAQKVMIKRGVTLLELLVVIIIVGILAGLGTVRWGIVVENARSAEAYSMLAEIVNSERAYYAEHDRYNDDFTELDRFEEDPTSDNFIYSLNLGAATNYAKATARDTNKNSYFMCLESSKKGVCTSRDNCSNSNCP